MNSFLELARQKRLVLWCVPVLLWLPLLLVRSVPSLACLFGSIALFGSFAVLAITLTISAPRRAKGTEVHTAPEMAAVPERRVDQGQKHVAPAIPMTALEAHHMLTDAAFELFAAAVVIVVEKDRGLAFVEHTGKGGDRGVDVRLCNAWGGGVILQAKRYAHTNPVRGPALVHFQGALALHQAVYGFFVTTSRFTKEARFVTENVDNHVHAIDGQKLDVYLQYHAQEIAQEYDRIRRRVAGNSE